MEDRSWSLDPHRFLRDMMTLMARIKIERAGQPGRQTVEMQREERIITPASSLAPYLRELNAASPRKVLLYGREAVHTTAVRFAAHAALRHTPVLVVDGANAFDPYDVARLAVQRQRAPETLLRSIWLARAFTCYQLRELIFRLEEQLGAQRSLVVIMGLCTTFFDDDVSLNEAAALFYQSWWKLAELNEQGVPLLVAQPLRPVNLRRRYFLDDLYRLSDLVLRVEPSARRLESLSGRPGPPARSRSAVDHL